MAPTINDRTRDAILLCEALSVSYAALHHIWLSRGDVMDDASDNRSKRVDDLASDLERTFREYSQIAERHPTSNPLLRLALDLSNRLEAGEITQEELEGLVQYLTVRGFSVRAERLSRYSGELDPSRNADTIRRIAWEQAGPNAASRRPFEHFKAWAECDLFGIVITAHPTFEIASDLMQALSELATGWRNGAPLGEADRERLMTRVASRAHRPEPVLDLKREQELALEAIAHIHAALRRVYRIVLDVAAEAYPDRWIEISPVLITVASWVGFDTDGRSDIGWSQAFERRLEGAAAQLRAISAAIDDIQARARSEELRLTLDLIGSRVSRALGDAESETEALTGFDPAQPGALGGLKRVARRMFEARGGRLDSAAPLIGLLNRAVRLGEGDSDLLRNLAVLRAELANFGLGTSHIHARINATQLHNAIRRAVGLEASPDDPRHRQSFITRITDLIGAVEPVSINFGSMIQERTSSKRLFMTLAQILKYVDRTTRIVFSSPNANRPSRC